MLHGALLEHCFNQYAMLIVLYNGYIAFYCHVHVF